MTRARFELNPTSRETLVRRGGGGGMDRPPRAGVREVQSVRDQLRTGGGRIT